MLQQQRNVSWPQQQESPCSSSRGSMNQRQQQRRDIRRRQQQKTPLNGSGGRGLESKTYIQKKSPEGLAGGPALIRARP